MKFIFTVFVFVAVAAHADARKKCFPVPTPVVDPPFFECPKNEVYSECGANGCQSTCENPTLNQVCKAQCIAGCICNEGYLRDSNGNCVSANECQQSCKKFEIFSDCAPEACKKTCDTLNTACRAPCVPGCKCPEGLVYRDDNRDACVAPEECPVIVVDPPVQECSKKFESYNECGTACPLTCDNVNNPPMVCTANCVPGCFCEDGYVRNSNGDCVPQEECPVVVVDPPVKVCQKSHESYLNCGSACPLTCDKPTPGRCTKQCVEGCFCEDGYFRNNNGDCVLLEECPKPKCGKHETYSDCGASACQATCANPSLPMMCKAPCKPGCGCDDGYVREKDGSCVLLKKCQPTLECGVNEVYEACTTLCGEATCDRRNAFYCGAGGCQPKCLCKQGYVRNADNKCIASQDCPAPMPSKGDINEDGTFS